MKKFIFIFLLLLNSNISAETVNKIEVLGNDRISKETIFVYGDITINSDYTNLRINNLLKSLYSTNFFEKIDISLENKILKIIVKEYPAVNTITLHGEKAKKIREAIKERLTSKINGSFIKNNLFEDIELIKNIYTSLGFNFTEVTSKIEKISDTRINLNYYIQKGKKTKISKILFIGDKKIRDRRLRDIVASEEDKPWKFLSRNTSLNIRNIELDKRLLTNYYKSIGYYDVQVISSSAVVKKNDTTNLTYNINAGRRYKIIKFSTITDEVLDKKIFFPLEKVYKKSVGKYYSPFLVKKILDKVDFVINSNDLQFVEHSVNEIIDENGIEVKINIYEGEKKLVEKINISGNTITNEHVIRSEFLLDEGDPFSSLKLSKTVAKLKSRNIFGIVKEKVSTGSSKNLKIIDLTVEEKPTGEISAGAGIGTSGASIEFNISENNWLGEGIKISTFFAAGTESIKGGIDFVQPNWNNTGNALTYNVSSSTNETSSTGYKNTITSAGIGTKFEQYENIYIGTSLSASLDNLSVGSASSAAMKKQAGEFTELGFNYSVGTDRRDRSYMPRSGYIASFQQNLPVYSERAYVGNAVSVSKYRSLGPDVIAAVKFYSKAVNGLQDNDVTLSRRLRLSNNKLRGFRKNKLGPRDGAEYVGGNYAAALNLESTLPNLLPESLKTEIGFFLDFGNVWGVDYSDNINESSKIRSSTGVAASWLSPLGPMSFVFAKNIQKKETDQTEGFSFKLGTTF